MEMKEKIKKNAQFLVTYLKKNTYLFPASIRLRIRFVMHRFRFRFKFSLVFAQFREKNFSLLKFLRETKLEKKIAILVQFNVNHFN